MVSSIGRFFYTRPALKRGALALVLQQLVVLPLGLIAAGSGVGLVDIWAALVSLQWTIFLVGLFWGMGAERASTEWDGTFALPPLKSFDFWRWHALEKKRFMAVLVSLMGGLLLATFVGAL
jgi:hypothetical protein